MTASLHTVSIELYYFLERRLNLHIKYFTNINKSYIKAKPYHIRLHYRDRNGLFVHVSD
jgi:hypothetical protein